MEVISVFDMFKIGIGPSSSHTLGPWRAAQRFLAALTTTGQLDQTHRVDVHLYGSLALTGIGHGTDIALLLGLSGYEPETIPIPEVRQRPQYIQEHHLLQLGNGPTINFDPHRNLQFHFTESLPFHSNGMRFEALDERGTLLHTATLYSIGGGFICTDSEPDDLNLHLPPYPVHNAKELRGHCLAEMGGIWEVALANERFWRKPSEVHRELHRIWEVMLNCVYQGCHSEGELPGGLQVARRAAALNRKLLGRVAPYDGPREWIERIRDRHYSFPEIVKWIGCFAMAVNEENASFGRVVTSPTNGAAGVIPAVIMYFLCFTNDHPSEDEIVKFLLTAGTIGSIFKQGATISAAMGGCQAEIGVSSSMAAAALTEIQGGSVGQAMMAAEIAMEHHLGLTCDPIAGLVQVPCIERNSMGAVKAITAANIALESDPTKAKVSLDDVVKTMWETAQDMHHKYKETAQGGLAVHVSVGEAAC